MYSLLEPFSIRTFSVSHFIHFPLFVNSVTFQNELIGELWYDLVLKASTPVASPLPVVHCELGRYYISITMLLYISILRVLCCRLLYVVLYLMLVLYWWTLMQYRKTWEKAPPPRPPNISHPTPSIISPPNLRRKTSSLLKAPHSPERNPGVYSYFKKGGHSQ